jgi:hypothetical protein
MIFINVKNVAASAKSQALEAVESPHGIEVLRRRFIADHSGTLLRWIYALRPPGLFDGLA